MKKTVIALKKIEVTNYQPRTNAASLKIAYQRDNDLQSMYRETTLANPEELTAAIIQDLKSRSKMEILEADDPLGSIVVLDFYDEDKIEEKLFNFLAKLCEKARNLKHLTNHQEYMKMYDEIKVQRASF